MTLLVADDNRRSLRDVLPSDAVTVDAEAVADAVASDDPDVVVVDAGAVADAAGIVDAVRENARGTAVVAVGTTGTDADVTCAATDESSVQAAVERARQVAEYRRSVADLYEACRDRAVGRPDADLRDRRRDADEKFERLPTDRETFSAALRTDADERPEKERADGRPNWDGDRSRDSDGRGERDG
ncbi:MAG: hypothetical protein ABEH83_01865 [Halobacterium sp.]